MAHPQNQPLTRLPKPDRITVAQTLRLNTQGTVKDLCLRIRVHSHRTPTRPNIPAPTPSV
ncbi:hypothetical protein P691DRAFT_800942, partial [Macrolepiota fuliginosa MF-IS2]